MAGAHTVKLSHEEPVSWPFRAGRGVEPRGFVHGLRRGVYTLSQRARPRSEQGRER